MSMFHIVDDIPVHKKPFGEMRVLSGKQTMVFWAKVDAGAHVAMHSHPNEQVTWLVSGRMDFRFSTGEERSCGPGTVVVVPAGVEHESWYREDCQVVEFFAPPRLDLFPAAATNPYGIV